MLDCISALAGPGATTSPGRTRCKPSTMTFSPTDRPLVTEATVIAPPRPLGKFGMAFWQRVQGEYAIRDCGGVEILVQACGAIDRVESLAAIIAQDGEDRIVLRVAPPPRDHAVGGGDHLGSDGK